MLDVVLISSLLGIVVGLLAGLFGIGGGLVIVPALSMLFAAKGFADSSLMLMAVATSLATIVLTSIAAIIAHQRLGAVSWVHVWRLVPGITSGTVLGSLYAEQLSTPALRWICGIYLLLVGIQMGLQLKPVVKGLRYSMWVDTIAGLVIGFLSALVGIGGGTLIVPFLLGCHLQMKYAVASSSACGLPIAIAGSISYICLGWNVSQLPAGSLGYVYLPAFIGIVSMSMCTAPMGARLAHRLPAQKLKRYFSLLLFVMAFKMLVPWDVQFVLVTSQRVVAEFLASGYLQF